MQSDLRDKTLTFWNISTCYNGAPSQLKSISTEKAIKAFGDTLAVLNPYRPLAFRLRTLQDAIVVGSPKRKKADLPPPAKILKLRVAN